jgi:hypothetical protein
MENVHTSPVELSQGFRLPFSAKVAIFLAAIALLTYASVAFAPLPGDALSVGAEYASPE